MAESGESTVTTASVSTDDVDLLVRILESEHSKVCPGLHREVFMTARDRLVHLISLIDHDTGANDEITAAIDRYCAFIKRPEFSKYLENSYIRLPQLDGSVVELAALVKQMDVEFGTIYVILRGTDEGEVEALGILTQYCRNIIIVESVHEVVHRFLKTEIDVSKLNVNEISIKIRRSITDEDKQLATDLKACLPTLREFYIESRCDAADDDATGQNVRESYQISYKCFTPTANEVRQKKDSQDGSASGLKSSGDYLRMSR